MAGGKKNNMEKIPKVKLKRKNDISQIKVLTEEVKKKICDYEKANKGFNLELNNTETEFIEKGFKYTGKPENYLSSFRYAIARVFNKINPILYPYISVGNKKTFIENIKRVKYDNEKKTLCFIFSN
jgi:hypothetical protein